MSALPAPQTAAPLDNAVAPGRSDSGADFLAMLLGIEAPQAPEAAGAPAPNTAPGLPGAGMNGKFSAVPAPVMTAVKPALVKNDTKALPVSTEKEERPSAILLVNLINLAPAPLPLPPPRQFGLPQDAEATTAAPRSETPPAPAPPPERKTALQDLAFDLQLSATGDAPATPVVRPVKEIQTLLKQPHENPEVPAVPVAATRDEAPATIVFDVPPAKGGEPLSVLHEAVKAPERPVESGPPPAAPVKPLALRELALRVDANSGNPVDVHVVDEHGKLRVEVRTSDGGLASTLRENVSELVQKLDHAGYHATQTSDEPARPSAGASSRAGEQDGSFGSGGNQSGQQRQPGQGRNHRRWLNTMAGMHESEPIYESED